MALLPQYVLSSCCYSFTSEPHHHKSSRSHTSPSFALSITTSSQYAVNTPGSVYEALITFPETYVLSKIPSGCVSVPPNVVNCTSSGTDQLVADFKRIIVADGSQPKLESVLVHGETCTSQSSCPTLNPTTVESEPELPPSPLIRSAKTAVHPDNATISEPPKTPSTLEFSTEPVSEDNGPSKWSAGLIAGITVAIAAAVLFLLACLYFLRRNKKRNRSVLPLSRGASDNHVFRNGSALYAAYQGKPPVYEACTKDAPQLPPIYSAAEGAMIPEKSVFGMTLVGIPETAESEDSKVDYLRNEKDQVEYISEREEDASCTDLVGHGPTDRQSQSEPSSPHSSAHWRRSWTAATAGMTSRLHRAVSATLLLQKESSSRRSSRDQDQDNASIRSEPNFVRPAKSIHRPLSRQILGRKDVYPDHDQGITRSKSAMSNLGRAPMPPARSLSRASRRGYSQPVEFHSQNETASNQQAVGSTDLSDASHAPELYGYV
ncbi:hypothetical protein BG011_005759 [Mortierella polycephala]|uniref:Uncharacterized protein n=1 Tax=Mortierella polycephala TaxID=41804 RepID=A0A9P6PX07_9FUNG|nr:hypothetical protein BG011_005759 [Mortierella polycephala]